MKRIIFIIILIVLLVFIKIPSYRELNDLKIIKYIYVCDNYYYLEEVIPIRDDNGIEYDKKIYKVKNISNKYFIKYVKYKKCKNKKGIK